MTDKYIPQVGDRVRLPHWATDYLDVEAVTDQHVYGVDNNDMPDGWRLANAWVKIDKPRQIPECWLTVDHDDEWVSFLREPPGVDDDDIPHDTYRIWSDPDGTPRIERVDGEAN